MHKNLLLRYLFVGGVSYVLEIGVLYSLAHIFHLSALLSVSISFWVGFCVAFLLQKLITFQNYSKATKTVGKQILFYSLLVAWNYIFTLSVVHLFSAKVSVIIIRTSVIALTTAWNYVIYKQLFKKSPETI